MSGKFGAFLGISKYGQKYMGLNDNVILTDVGCCGISPEEEAELQKIRDHNRIIDEKKTARALRRNK